MYRKIGTMLLAMLLLTGLGKPAQAAQQTGSVRITLENQEGEVALYHTGIPAQGGYRLDESFGGGFVKEEDVQSPALAQWLAESADEGRYRILDADGNAEFSGLEEGLYLLVQTETEKGYYPVNPFLIPMPCDGQWDIQANPKTQQLAMENPKTGQPVQPLLGMAGMVMSGTGLLLCGRKKKEKE